MTHPPYQPLSGGPRYGGTWDDLQDPKREATWRRIRSFRHRPPASAAAQDQRRRVFVSALEQAEELFTAAADVDYPSRPILLFYGLSQAGRTIAAASTSTSDNEWNLSGHGITVKNLGKGADLQDPRIEDHRRGGSFTRLAPILRSGSLPNGTSLGQVWNILPDLAVAQPNISDSNYLPTLKFESEPADHAHIRGWIVGAPAQFDAVTPDEEIAKFLDNYPTLTGSQAATGDWGHLRVRSRRDCHVDLMRQWPRTAIPDPHDQQALLSIPYRGDNDRWIFPALGCSDVAFGPLMAWCALLFTLSMLARYEPDEWVHHVDIDSSVNAVALEAAMDRALDTCPELIHYSIRAVGV